MTTTAPKWYNLLMSEQEEWIRQLTKFRLEHIEPYMEEDDAAERFRPDIYRRMGGLGLAGLCLPEEYGGSALGQKEQISALAEIAKSSVAYAVTLSVSTMVQKIIALHGQWGSKATIPPGVDLRERDSPPSV